MHVLDVQIILCADVHYFDVQMCVYANVQIVHKLYVISNASEKTFAHDQASCRSFLLVPR
jgi:hypothetical protein